MSAFQALAGTLSLYQIATAEGGERMYLVENVLLAIFDFVT